MTIAEIAIARFQTALAVGFRRTSVLTYRPYVPWPTFELSGHVITRQIVYNRSLLIKNEVPALNNMQGIRK